MEKIKWTEEDAAYLIQHYQNVSSIEIAHYLGRKISAIYNKAFVLDLKKSEEYLNSIQSGRINKLMLKGWEYRFNKGNKALE